MLKNIPRTNIILTIIVLICINSVCIAFWQTGPKFDFSGGSNIFGKTSKTSKSASTTPNTNTENKNQGQQSNEDSPTKQQDTANVKKLFEKATYENFESLEDPQSEGTKIFDEDLLKKPT